jgi:hypothetical protein
MASIPPPPDRPAQSFTPPADPQPGPSSKTTIIAILVSVAVIATIGTVVALANSGDGQGSASASAGATGGVAPIDAVTARETSSRVTLTWTVGTGSAAVRYAVSRNGSVAANLQADATQWVDRDVLPESRYRYAVRAIGQDGTTSTSHVSARTRSAPLATAPLTGVFDVHLHATSHFGFSSFGQETGNAGWKFTPMCANGPCDAKLADLHQKDLRLTLDRNGTSYHGTVTIDGLVRCGGAPVTSNITVTVRVADAGVVHQAWVATRIEGTMDQSSSQQLGCVASGATYQLKGKVVKAGR